MMNNNFFSNAETAFAPDTDASGSAQEGDWVRLATFGTHPHPKGRQRFTRQAGREMTRYFNSLRGRLARRFGGIPVYIGHPDDPAFARQPGHQDTRAYAWIHALEDREDGLWALPRWSEAGGELLKNAFYKYLSPRWAMKPLGDGVFQPVRLLSVGLTNRPNIPGEPITEKAQRSVLNSEIKLKQRRNKMIEKITDKLGLSPDANEEEILQSLESLLDDSRQWNEAGAVAANQAETLRKETERLQNRVNDAENHHRETEKALAEAEEILAN